MVARRRGHVNVGVDPRAGTAIDILDDGVHRIQRGVHGIRVIAGGPPGPADLLAVVLLAPGALAHEHRVARAVGDRGDRRVAVEVEDAPGLPHEGAEGAADAGGVLIPAGGEPDAGVPLVAGEPHAEAVVAGPERRDLGVAGAPDRRQARDRDRRVRGGVVVDVGVESVEQLRLLIEGQEPDQDAVLVPAAAWRRRRVARRRSPIDRRHHVGADREGAIGGLVIGASQRELLEVVGALGAAGGLPRRLDRGQQQGDQHCDDRDYHQQLDQGETPGGPWAIRQTIHERASLMVRRRSTRQVRKGTYGLKHGCASGRRPARQAGAPSRCDVIERDSFESNGRESGTPRLRNRCEPGLQHLTSDSAIQQSEARKSTDLGRLVTASSGCQRTRPPGPAFAFPGTPDCLAFWISSRLFTTSAFGAVLVAWSEQPPSPSRPATTAEPNIARIMDRRSSRNAGIPLLNNGNRSPRLTAGPGHRDVVWSRVAAQSERRDESAWRRNRGGITTPVQASEDSHPERNRPPRPYARMDDARGKPARPTSIRGPHPRLSAARDQFVCSGFILAARILP